MEMSEEKFLKMEINLRPYNYLLESKSFHKANCEKRIMGFKNIS